MIARGLTWAGTPRSQPDPFSDSTVPAAARWATSTGRGSRISGASRNQGPVRASGTRSAGGEPSRPGEAPEEGEQEPAADGASGRAVQQRKVMRARHFAALAAAAKQNAPSSGRTRAAGAWGTSAVQAAGAAPTRRCNTRVALSRDRVQARFRDARTLSDDWCSDQAPGNFLKMTRADSVWSTVQRRGREETPPTLEACYYRPLRTCRCCRLT